MPRDDFEELLNGLIGPNPNKQRGDNKPDYTGSVTFEGEKSFVSVWKKFNVERQEFYFAFSVSKPKNPSESSATSTKGRPSFDDDDDIPF